MSANHLTVFFSCAFFDDVIPEVEGSYDPAGVQKLVYDNAHDAVIVAATHWCVWMRHDNSAFPPCLFSFIVGRLAQDIGMVDAAIKRCVIVDGGYREGVVGFWRATHVSGRLETPLHVLIACF
jgi:hypothetical protein